MNSKLTEKRDYLFDNLKALMLFLVVIGHILDPYIERQDSLYRYLMQYIYLFHMPMFAFITGYFTKNTEKARNSAVRNVLVPYIFWQLLYIITALLFIRLGLASYNTDVFKPSLLLPSSPLYYLLCVFVWKVFAADLKKLRFPVLFSFAAGLFISVVFDEAFHIGWGACFSLMIFFVLGLLCTKEHVEKIRNIPHAIAAAILAAAVTLLSVLAASVPLCVIGLCVTGLSYGACPTISSAFTSAFYGTKHFPVNFSIMNFNLMGASFMATAASVLLGSTGGYVAPFLLLLVLALAALVLNLSVRRP